MADSTISGLTAATALQAADLAAVVQGGTTKKATLAQIQANSLPLAGGTMTGDLNVGPAQITSAGGQGDLFGGASSYSLRIGSDTSSSALRTDATYKAARIVCPHYTNAEQPALMMLVTCTINSNLLQFGGGTSLANAATRISFRAAANHITVTGTEMMRLTTAGVRIESGATANASSLFHVAATGDASALRVDDTTGHTGFGVAPQAGAQVSILTASSQLRLLYSGSQLATFAVSSAGALTISTFGSGPQIAFIGPAASTLSVLRVEQLDDNEPFIDFDGTEAADATKSLSSWTTGGSVNGFVRIAVNGTDRWIPTYSAPTS